MAARVLRRQEVADAVKTFCELHPEYEKSLSDSGGITLMPGDVLVGLNGEGKLEVKSPDAALAQEILGKLCEIIAEAGPREPARGPRSEAKAERPNVPAPQRSGQVLPASQTVRDVQVADLTMQDIKDFICPDATEQEAFMFLKLCQARNLNPFTREAYLVKYGGKANMIVGKEAFTRKAEMHPQFDGFRAGVLVKKGDAWEEREGSFLMQGEELLGGFAEVYRKDRKQPFKAMVSLKEYSKSQATWKDMPGVMIRKVALVSALREAFACDLGGMYDAAEVEGST